MPLRKAFYVTGLTERPAYGPAATEGTGLTNAMGKRKPRKERRRDSELPPEHDFSVTAIGISVVCVVIVVMFSV